MMKDYSGKVGGLDRADGDVGRRGVSGLEGIYYASDSTLRRFYAGHQPIWLIFSVLNRSLVFKAKWALSVYGICAERYEIQSDAMP